MPARTPFEKRTSCRYLLLSLTGMAAAALMAAAGCGRIAKGTPEVGGESHFLHWCSGSCGEQDLECISGLCTKPCVVAEPNACGAFSGATCTDRSIEPGAVAICDIGCNQDSDCAALGGGYACEEAFCRAPELTNGSSGAAGAASGGTGGVANGEAGQGGRSASGGTAGSSSVLACAECLESPTLSWRWLGMIVPGARHTSILTGCNSYRHEVVIVGADDQLGSPQCAAPVDGCPSPDLAVLNATLQDPELQAGLAAQTVFGLDELASDGMLRQISVGDASLLVGEPCGGASPCTEIPPAVSSLIAQLQVLDAKQMAKETCASVFPDGGDF